jgi:hypothetical protein
MVSFHSEPRVHPHIRHFGLWEFGALQASNCVLKSGGEGITAVLSGDGNRVTL